MVVLSDNVDIYFHLCYADRNYHGQRYYLETEAANVTVPLSQFIAGCHTVFEYKRRLLVRSHF
jgi:hypothetical protein